MSNPHDTRRDQVFQRALVDGVDQLPRKAGVYCILNRCNGRRYVGLAQNIHQRGLFHRGELSRGMSSNPLLRRDAQEHGPSAFFLFAIRLDGFSDDLTPQELEQLEIWFATQMGSHDERYGYNLEAGHHRTRASRLRDRERKLLRPNSSKYQLLAGVKLHDPVNPAMLDSWVPGS